MSSHPPNRKMRLLVINPNSSKEMTHGMDTAIQGMALAQV